MTDTTQTGFPLRDGSIDWQEPQPTTLDSRTNLFKRWRAAGTFDAHHVTAIHGGIEVDQHPGANDPLLKGIRQRLVWGEDLERIANSPVGRCEHCKGETNVNCPEHGISASLKRENDFWRDRGGCAPGEVGHVMSGESLPGLGDDRQDELDTFAYGWELLSAGERYSRAEALALRWGTDSSNAMALIVKRVNGSKKPS